MGVVRGLEGTVEIKYGKKNDFEQIVTQTKTIFNWVLRYQAEVKHLHIPYVFYTNEEDKKYNPDNHVMVVKKAFPSIGVSFMEFSLYLDEDETIFWSPLEWLNNFENSKWYVYIALRDGLFIANKFFKGNISVEGFLSSYEISSNVRGPVMVSITLAVNRLRTTFDPRIL